MKKSPFLAGRSNLICLTFENLFLHLKEFGFFSAVDSFFTIAKWMLENYIEDFGIKIILRYPISFIQEYFSEINEAMERTFEA